MTPPLLLGKHLLRTSHPPKQAEAIAVRRVLTEQSLKIHVLEDQIISLQTKQRLLSLEKQTLTTFIECHGALLSPSNKLTDDVLQEIFYHCLPTAHRTILSIHEPPLSLGRVCRRWRQIVYCTPKLWTSIHITATPLSCLSRRDNAWKNAITSWLSRSGVLPLSISIYSSDQMMPAIFGMTTNSRIQPYLDLILPYARRWRSLHLRLNKVNWVNILSQIKSTDVPLLEHLNIKAIDSYDDVVYASDQISSLAGHHEIFCAPLLHALALPDRFVRVLWGHSSWYCMTDLDLTSFIMNMSEIFGILSQCQNLATCTLGYGAEEGDTWTSVYPIHSLTLPNLWKLSVYTGSPEEVIIFQILDRLITPGLVHLSYRMVQFSVWGITWTSMTTESRTTRSLINFLDRLSRPLEELDLWCEPIEETAITDILKSVPGLKRLLLQGKIPPKTQALPAFSGSGASTPNGAWGRRRHPKPTCLNDSLLSLLTPGHRSLPSSAQDSVSGMENVGPQQDDEDTVPVCPNLEVVSISWVSFSHEVLLAFLRSRSMQHEEHGVARLRKASIHIGVTYSGKPDDREEIDLQQQLVRLGEETSMEIFLNYPSSSPLPTPIPPFSSKKIEMAYEGVWLIDDVFTQRFS